MTTEEEDEVIATLTDYLDARVSKEKKAEIEAKLASDEDWKRIHAEMKETRDDSQISGLIKARAPAPPALDDKFTSNVTEKINKRSAGRFFGRRTFGDRVPFEALLVVAVLGLAVIGYLLWSSQTGSLKVDKKGSDAPKTEPIAPKP